MAYGIITTFKDGSQQTTMLDSFFHAQVERLVRTAEWAKNPQITDVRLVVVEVEA